MGTTAGKPAPAWGGAAQGRNRTQSGNDVDGRGKNVDVRRRFEARGYIRSRHPSGAGRGLVMPCPSIPATKRRPSLLAGGRHWLEVAKGTVANPTPADAWAASKRVAERAAPQRQT
jgi:hypothetical protein